MLTPERREFIIDQLTDIPNRLFYYPLAKLLVKPAALTPVTPTQISIFHACISLVVAVLITFNEPFYFYIAFALNQLRAVLDCLDGSLARYKKMTSSLGRTIDTYADALGFVSLITGIVFVLKEQYPVSTVVFWITCVVLTANFMAHGTDFFKRKYTSALRNQEDEIGKELLNKKRELQAPGAHFLHRLGYANDWFQVIILTPLGIPAIRKTLATGELDYKEDRAINSMPERTLRIFFTLISLMTGDIAIFIITLGLLFNDLLLFIKIATFYGVVLVVATVIYRQILLRIYTQEGEHAA